MTEDILQIRTTKQLKDLAKRLKVRADWHEPDEQGVEVKMEGSHLDNAFMSLNTAKFPNREFNVIILQDKKSVAWINLANLFAMAVGTFPDTGEPKGISIDITTKHLKYFGICMRCDNTTTTDSVDTLNAFYEAHKKCRMFHDFGA